MGGKTADLPWQRHDDDTSKQIDNDTDTDMEEDRAGH